MSSEKITKIIKSIRKRNLHDNISMYSFMKTIENIIMELSPKETKKFYKELAKVQHKPGGAIDPPVPNNLKKFYNYTGISYAPQKKIYFKGKPNRKGSGQKLDYNSLDKIGKLARKYIKKEFGL